MYFLKSIFFVVFLVLAVNAQSVRPVRDNIGFCWTADDMDKVISHLESLDNGLEDVYENIVGGISPHDDFLYSGKVIFSILKQIKVKEVLVFSVTHGTVRKAINDPKGVVILDEFDQWIGPYGNVEISPLREEIKKHLVKNKYIVSNKAHEIEHSIEALIPFLQYYNRDIKITPIMVTGMSFDEVEQIAKEISGIVSAYLKDNNIALGKDFAILISNDANHYGVDFDNTHFGIDKEGHKLATENDKRICNTFFNGPIDKNQLQALTKEIWEDDSKEDYTPLWCGRYPIILGLMTTKLLIQDFNKNVLRSKFLEYSDTKSDGVMHIPNTSLGITAPFSYEHWVGYFSTILQME